MALRALLPVHVAPRVIDLGCGLGDVIARLAPARFDASFVGYEVAPLPALVAWLRNRHHANVRIARRDFWAENLGTYDVVYAFLSPAAMPELWRKARAEMKPGTLLISNSFPVPGVEPDRIVPLAGRGSNALYLYRL
jgi:SAM-dependent methyltransferase